MSTIFVTIPAYEDPLLINTITQAINQASGMHEMRFAIALQYKKIPKPDLTPFMRGCQVIEYDVDTRPTVNYIRSQLLDFYRNEDYFLMIDSHMNFAKNWDKDLIDMLNHLGPRAIISKQVSDKAGDVSMHDNLINEKTVWHWHEDEPGGISGKLKGYPEPTEDTSAIRLTNYAAFGFFFTYGYFIPQVGITRIQNHYAEESLLSYIAYIKGWDIYAPRNYNHLGHNDSDYNMAVFGKEHPDEKKIWGIQKDDNHILEELDKLFLNASNSIFKIDNQVRSTEDFYEQIGLKQKYLELLEIHHLKQK